MEWVEIAAASVDEAKELALDRLGVTASEIELEVLQEASSSLFGLRKSDARIRARVKPTKPPAKAGEGRRDRDRGRASKGRRSGQGGRKPKNQADQSGDSQKKGSRAASSKAAAEKKSDQKPDKAATTSSSSPAPGAKGPSADRVGESDDRQTEGSGPRRRRRRAAGTKSPQPNGAGTQPNNANKRIRRLADEATPTSSIDNNMNKDQEMSEELSLEEQGRLVAEFLDGVVESFGLTGKASVTSIDEDWIDVAIEGDGLGLLIGPGGRTLSALAEVAKTALQRHVGDGRRGRVRVDVGGYREYRREALGQFAREQAAAVAADGKARVLEPMGSADRKVVHDAVIDVEGIGSTSEGDEPRRRVVLIPAD